MNNNSNVIIKYIREMSSLNKANLVFVPSKFSGICFFNQSITQIEEKLNFQIKSLLFVTLNDL